MSTVLKDLKPYEVFKYFEEMSQIPRGSKNEKAISDYLVAFAKEHNLEVIQDKALNVIIKKPATVGYEKAPIVVLQGHMDMVCEKNIGTEHDFEKDPLKLRIEGDMIMATGTTLGADNGVAVAFGLAVLAAKDIPHPALELLVTTDEETGMTGAVALDPKDVTGRILVNIDSEEEGKLLVSCSGGVRQTTTLPITWETVKEGTVLCAVRVRGLKGGHSGMEIHKQRGNSNKLMGRFLADLASKVEFSVASLNGGSKSNAIPREADVVLVLPSKEVGTVEAMVKAWDKTFKGEFRTADPAVTLQFEKVDSEVKKVFSKETAEKAIALLTLIPNGVQSMSMEIEGLVQSSTNLGVVTTVEEGIVFDSATRSSVKTLKEDIVLQCEKITKLVDGKFETMSDYPAWEYNPNSKIRDLFVEVYEKNYGKKPEVYALHAGVECGLFGEKFGEIDMISFGSNLYDVHTPEEKMSISSAQRTFEYLLAVLKEIR